MPEERLLDGTVEAVNQSTVSAQTAGPHRRRPLRRERPVPAGAVILRIRSTEQVAGLTQAQAALKEATAREAEAQPRYQRINDMYQRRVVAKATLDEASAGARRGRRPAESRREPGSMRPARGSRTRRSAHRTPAVRDAEIRPGRASWSRPARRSWPVASLDALRVVVEVPQSVIEQVRKVRKAVVYVDGQRVESTGLTLFPVGRSRRPTRSACASSCRRACRASRPACSSRSGS